MTDADWPRPSPAAERLIREVAQGLLSDPAGAFEAIDQAVLLVAPPSVVAEPSLVDGMRASTQANLAHWTLANVSRPGRRVPPNIAAETLDIARDAVRRGVDRDALDTYRVGQNAAWRTWMNAVFDRGDDPAVIREALDLTARSVAAFVDETLAGLREQVESEREQLLHGTHGERLEVVNLILSGAPITTERASARLGWELRRRHTAAVVWDVGGAADGALQRAADAVAAAAGAIHPLVVVASTASIWVWVAGEREPDAATVKRALRDEAAGAGIALGLEREGSEGFRRSHLEARAVQALVHRRAGGLPIAAYREAQIAVLGGADADLARDFALRTLGDLAAASPELRETLRIYVRSGFSTSEAARVLVAHRNTVLGRVARARELLPGPLEEARLEIGVALELIRWLGPPAGAPTGGVTAPLADSGRPRS